MTVIEPAVMYVAEIRAALTISCGRRVARDRLVHLLTLRQLCTYERDWNVETEEWGRNWPALSG